MLKAIQFDRQFCIGAIEIQNVPAHRVLPAEFETGKAPSAQRAPEFLFLIGLITTKLAGDWFEAHAGKMLIVGKNSSPLTPALSRLGGERGKTREMQDCCNFQPQSFFNSVLAS